MRSLSFTWSVALMLLVACLLGACSKDKNKADDPKPTPTPTPIDTTQCWERAVEGADFTINSQNVALTGDGISVNYSNYYVTQASLPKDGFHSYSLHLLVPADTLKYTLDISDLYARLRTKDSSEYWGVLTSLKYKDLLELNGHLYARYLLDMQDANVNASTFEKLAAFMTVAYKDNTTQTVTNKRDLKVEIHVK